MCCWKHRASRGSYPSVLPRYILLTLVDLYNHTQGKAPPLCDLQEGICHGLANGLSPAKARAIWARQEPQRILTKFTDCSLRQGAMPLKGTYKGDIFSSLASAPRYVSRVFDLKAVFFELLHAKPCRIISTFHQKLNFESET